MVFEVREQFTACSRSKFASATPFPRRRTSPRTETFPRAFDRGAQLVPQRLKFRLGVDNVVADGGCLGHQRGSQRRWLALLPPNGYG
jgi:hypothetical protein